MNAKKTWIIVIWMSLFLTACSGGQTGATPEVLPPVPADAGIVAEGRLEPMHYAEIAFSTGGVVSDVLVEAGEAVKKGEPLVRLANNEAARAQVALAQEALILAERAFGSSQADALKSLGEAYEAVRKAQINLDNYDVPSYLQGGTPAQGVGKMYAELEKRRAAYEPYQYRGVNDRTRKEERKRLDEAWERFNTAIRWAKLEAELQRAQLQLTYAQGEFEAAAGSQAGSLAQARYETAQTNRLAAQAALANVELAAPFDGTVAALEATEGSSINAGQMAVSVADFSNWVVRTTDLTEIDVVNLVEGQPATITLDAIPGVDLRAKILSIGQNYSESQGDVVYEVTLVLEDTHPAMRWGMTSSVKFENDL